MCILLLLLLFFQFDYLLIYVSVGSPVNLKTNPKVIITITLSIIKYDKESKIIFFLNKLSCSNGIFSYFVLYFFCGN